MIIIMTTSVITCITCYLYYDLYSYVWNVITIAISSTTVAISAVVISIVSFLCTIAFMIIVTTTIISTVGRLPRNLKP